jgi:hypothetical protein
MPRTGFVLLAFLLYNLHSVANLSSSSAASPASKATAARSASPLRITAPEEGAAVPERPFVKGRIKSLHAKVWVVVHPMEVSDYWVQQPVTVGEDGAWEVQIHVGQPGPDDVGKRFEIRALANPKSTLRQGDTLGGWPDARWYSQVVRVTRE